MKKTKIWDEIYDFHPRTWISPFRKTTPAYLLKMLLFYHLIGFGLSLLSNFMPTVYFNGISLPIHGNVLSSLIFSPLLEETLFFGIPYYLIGNNFLMLLTGIMWSFFHPLLGESSSFDFASLFMTIPILFFSLRTWTSKKGWFAILAHIGYNMFVELIDCFNWNFNCFQLENIHFEKLGFQILIMLSLSLLITNYVIFKIKRDKLKTRNTQ